MGEIGRQLVANSEARRECRRKARAILPTLLVKLAMSTDEALAELEIEAVKLLVEQLDTQKYVMRNLLKERGELHAAAAGSDG